MIFSPSFLKQLISFHYCLHYYLLLSAIIFARLHHTFHCYEESLPFLSFLHFYHFQMLHIASISASTLSPLYHSFPLLWNKCVLMFLCFYTFLEQGSGLEQNIPALYDLAHLFISSILATPHNPVPQE